MIMMTMLILKYYCNWFMHLLVTICIEMTLYLYLLKVIDMTEVIKVELETESKKMFESKKEEVTRSAIESVTAELLEEEDSLNGSIATR